MGEYTARRPKGYITVVSDAGVFEADTLQCCHCGMHWRVKPGSGILRGFCQLCNQVTCGQKKCDEHLPFEKKLDLYERGRIRTLR